MKFALLASALAVLARPAFAINRTMGCCRMAGELSWFPKILQCAALTTESELPFVGSLRVRQL